MLRRGSKELMEQSTVLVALSGVLNSTLEQHEVRRRALKAMKRLLDCGASPLLMLDEKSGELYLEVALGKRGDKVKETRLKKGEEIAGWVAQTGRACIAHNVWIVIPVTPGVWTRTPDFAPGIWSVWCSACTRQTHRHPRGDQQETGLFYKDEMVALISSRAEIRPSSSSTPFTGVVERDWARALWIQSIRPETSESGGR